MGSKKLSIHLADSSLELLAIVDTITPKQLWIARRKAGLTQSQAAALIHKKLRTWQRYEAGDVEIDPAELELFLIKTGTAPGWCPDCRCPSNSCACS